MFCVFLGVVREFCLAARVLLECFRLLGGCLGDMGGCQSVAMGFGVARRLIGGYRFF